MTLAWTIMTLPYNAWGAELSGDYHERTKIAGVREGVGLFGTLIAASTPTIMGLMGYTDPRLHMMALPPMIVVLLVPTVVWATLAVPEVHPLSRARVTWRLGFKAIAENKPFRRLITAYLLNAFANGLPATLFLIFVAHVIGAPDVYGPLLLAYFLAGLLAIPFWLCSPAPGQAPHLGDRDGARLRGLRFHALCGRRRRRACVLDHFGRLRHGRRARILSCLPPFKPMSSMPTLKSRANSGRVLLRALGDGHETCLRAFRAGVSHTPFLGF